MGTRKLYEDKDLGFVVLAHCNAKPHKSPPHDHGPSWAVYGQALKHTDMSEFRRLDGGAWHTVEPVLKDPAVIYR